MKIEAFLRESPMIAVVRAARGFELQLGRLFKDKKLNLSTALVLVTVLFEEPQLVTPSQLAAVLFMTRGNVSHCISSLEGEGFIARRIHPDDARAHHLVLKPAGKRVAMQVVKVLHRMQTSFDKTVGAAQIRSFIQVMRQIEETCAETEAIH